MNDELKNLAEQKEKEWRDIQEKRIEILEKTLKQKSQDYNDEKTKFTRLKDDFKYNLKLLEERDAELEKYEQTILATRKKLSEKNSEISELKIKIDELKKVKETEKSAVDECKKYYLNRLTQKQNEIDKHKSLKDAEINQERSEIEKYKRTLKRELQDLQIDLETQRHELKTEFDEILRKREHEWRLQADEFSTQELAKELQIKMLTNELNQLKEITSSLKVNTCETETSLKTIERKLKEKEWELKDTIVLKDARIQEIEFKLAQFQENSKNANEDLNRKNEDMDRSIREKELCMGKLKISMTDLEKTNNYLEEQISEYKIQVRHTSQASKDNYKEKDKQILTLNEEIFRLKSDLSKKIEIKAKDTVKMDITVDNMEQKNEALIQVLEKAKNEISTLKFQLSDHINKLNELEHEKLQLNLDWQHKYKFLENLKAKDSEEFNMQILESRDQALNRIKTLEDSLSHKENVILALQTADPSLKQLDFDTNNEFQLKEENNKLKRIIKQMREEMENLVTEPALIPIKETQINNVSPNITSNQRSDFSTSNNNTNGVSEFEEDLKRQLQESKQKNRLLQSQLDEKMLNVQIPENLTDNTIINSHIKSLNETISILRKEKMDLTAFCKKNQGKLLHIEKSSSENTENLRLKQTQIETLNYEMSSQTRRTATEITNLKQMLANSELELSATRREADEYHKGTIEKGSEIASLETKISELKVKLSTSGTDVNFGAQELFIQQLQDEIKRLSNLNSHLQVEARQNHHQGLRETQEKNKNQKYNSEHCEQGLGPSLNELVKIKEIDELKSKLKLAAKFISHLIQEKEHLIEMSNQLRGELNRIKYDNDSLSLVRINRDVNSQLQMQNEDVYQKKSNPPSVSPAYKTALSSKLQQLEKRQYELTKQQLAFAQKKNITKSDPILNKTYDSTNYKDSESLTSTDDMNTMYSSVKSENLRDIWKIIDEHENNPMLEGDNTDQIASVIKVSVIKPSNGKKTTPIISNSKSPRPKSSRLETKIQKSKIRNYNDRT